MMGIKSIWHIWFNDLILSEWCHKINIFNEDYKIKRWMLKNNNYKYQTPEGKVPKSPKGEIYCR